MTSKLQMITEAYARDRYKPSIQAVLHIALIGRQYGFPLACSISPHSETMRIRAAACLLLLIGDTWPIDALPADFAPKRGSALFQDASTLMANALPTTSQTEQ